MLFFVVAVKFILNIFFPPYNNFFERTMLLSDVKSVKKRIPLLDELRGFTVLLMVIYHAVYSWGYIFSLPFGITLMNVLFPFHYVIPVLFVFISGICTKLSRSNLRRGLMLLIPALIINFVTIFAERYIQGIAIYFGVINMLSVVIILYGLFGKHLEKLPAVPCYVMCLLLFGLTWNVKNGYIGAFGIKLLDLPESLYKTKYLFPIGFPCGEFESADYFPLLPWLFLFLSGAYFASALKGSPILKSEKLYREHSRSLSFIGKYALYIYMVHQPVICGLTYAVLLRNH